MARAMRWIGFAFVVSLVLIVPTASAVTPPPYLTTNLTPSGISKITIGGYTGIGGNYTNTNPIIAGTQVIVLVDVMNGSNQTVLIAAGSTSFSSSKASFFAPFTNPPSGTYEVTVFVTTIDGVPISTVFSLSVVLP